MYRFALRLRVVTVTAVRYVTIVMSTPTRRC